METVTSGLGTTGRGTGGAPLRVVIGEALVITDSAVSKHINSIFAKLGLHPSDSGHRRVLAVLRYLGAAG